MCGYIDKSKGVLFWSHDLKQGLDIILNRLRNDIGNLDTSNLQDLKNNESLLSFIDDYKVMKLKLLKDQWYVEETETQIDVRYDPHRWISDKSRPALVPGQRIEVHVPFEGEKELFYARADQYTMNPPRALIQENELILIYEIPSDAPRELRADIDSTLDSIEELIKWQSNLIDGHNESLLNITNQLIDQRLKNLSSNANSLASLGIPIKPKNTN